jgi:hypothetical protein
MGKTPSSGLKRALAAAGGVLLALAVVAVGTGRLGKLGAPPGKTVAAAELPSAPPAFDPELPFRPILDEATTRKHFLLDQRKELAYDPLAYIVQAPNLSEKWPWPEHPDGGFVRRTNNLGFNEDEPTEAEKHGLRVLVAGDSHTAGLLNPAESFSNVAERALRRSLGREDVEVLNAGVAYTGPTCYLGTLQRNLALQPDVFVAVLFTGNDFIEETYLATDAGRWPTGNTPAQYYERAEPVQKRCSGPFWQGLNEAYRWKWFPDEVERSLEHCFGAYQAMKRLCDEHGIRFLAVILPTKMEVDEDDRETWLGAAQELELSEREVRLDLEVGRRLLERARAEGIECLDPSEAMIRSDEVLFWKADYHLGVRGSTLVGEQLAAALARLL